MKKLALFVVLAGLGLVTVRADSTSPFYNLTTVSWVLESRDNHVDDNYYVTLIGQVVQKDGDKGFWFTDGTGTVRVDLGKLDLPVGPKLVIGGKIDHAFLGIGHLKVDVEHWRLAKNP